MQQPATQRLTDSVILSGDTDRLPLEWRHRHVAIRVVIHRLAVQDSAQHCQLTPSARSKVEERELCTAALNMVQKN